VSVKPTVRTAVLANVASSASSVTVLATNNGAAGRAIFNDSSANLFLAFTATAASVTAFSVKLAAGASYEFQQPNPYTGQVNGIWDAANGFARCTEW
jgi:uncharacterized iron-regulated membrane protein